MSLPILLLLTCLQPAAVFAVAIERGAGAPVSITAQPFVLAPVVIPVSLTLHPLTKNPKAGEPVELEVRVAVRPGVYVEGPLYTQPLGDWAVMSLQAGTPAPQGGQQVRLDRLTLLTYRDGQVEIPGPTIRFRLPNGQGGEYRSEPLSLAVQPAAVPGGNLAGLLRDLKSPIGFFPLPEVLLVLALLAAAGAAVWWYARKRKWIGPLVPPAPPRPPEIVARARLAVLRAAGYLAAGNSKLYYSELSDILRRYLEARFRVAALDRTTQELARELKGASVTRPDVALVREILEHSDMAKFAKAQPAMGEAEADWQAVSDLVDHTTPVLQPEPAPAGGEGVKA